MTKINTNKIVLVVGGFFGRLANTNVNLFAFVIRFKQRRAA